MKKTEVIRTRIGIDLFEKLRTKAEKLDLPMSAVIRQAIKKHLEK